MLGLFCNLLPLGHLHGNRGTYDQGILAEWEEQFLKKIRENGSTQTKKKFSLLFKK